MDGCWADNCPADASTHARGEGDASAASADPSPTMMETHAGQDIEDVNMIDGNIKALSRHEGREGVVGKHQAKGIV